MQQLKEKGHSLDLYLREMRVDRTYELSTELLSNAEKKCRSFRTDEVDYALPKLIKLEKCSTSGK